MHQENRFLLTACSIDQNNVLNTLLDHEKIKESLKAHYMNSDEEKKRFKVIKYTRRSTRKGKERIQEQTR
jgi:hypothetical protein